MAGVLAAREIRSIRVEEQTPYILSVINPLKQLHTQTFLRWTHSKFPPNQLNGHRSGERLLYAEEASFSQRRRFYASEAVVFNNGNARQPIAAQPSNIL